MHASVMKFVHANLYPHEVSGKRVLEVGSADVNGSVRPMVQAMAPESYLGIDLVEGPGVDLVCDISGAAGETLQELRSEVLISTEMLEHAENWQGDLRAMTEVCSETLILTCRGIDHRGQFPYHNPPDFWRFRPSDLVRALTFLGMTVVKAEEDPQVPGVFIKAVWPGFLRVEPVREE